MKLCSQYFNSSELSFNELNPNWAVSADVLRSAVFMGYMWGVFYPSSKFNRWAKFGVGFGASYGTYEAKLYR